MKTAVSRMDNILSSAEVLKDKKPNSSGDNDDDLSGNDVGLDTVQKAQMDDQSCSPPVVSKKVRAPMFLSCVFFF
jgi:hypothetical protein